MRSLSHVYLILYPAAFVCLCAFLRSLILKRPFQPSWLYFTVIVGAFVAAAMIRPIGPDITIFHTAGTAFNSGIDPYTLPVLSSQFMNPPTALPSYGMIARLPLHVAARALTIANLIGGLLLVPLVMVIFRPHNPADDDALEVPAGAPIALTAVVMLSNSMFQTHVQGQMSVWTAVLIFSALACRRAGRALVAGVALALATVKIATLLPFLMLFLRRLDIKTWAAMVVTTALLCLLAGNPNALLAYAREMLENIRVMAEIGGVNDCSYANPISNSILGFDQLISRTELTQDRNLIRASQAVVLLVIGGWLLYQIVARRLDFCLSASLISLFSMVFLYHRIYDTVIFALPLTFATAAAWRADSRSRWWFLVAAIAMITVMYVPTRISAALLPLSYRLGSLGISVRALVLPYPTSLTLLSMACLWFGTLKNRKAPKDAEAGASSSPACP